MDLWISGPANQASVHERYARSAGQHHTVDPIGESREAFPLVRECRIFGIFDNTDREKMLLLLMPIRDGTI